MPDDPMLFAGRVTPEGHASGKVELSPIGDTDPAARLTVTFDPPPTVHLTDVRVDTDGDGWLVVQFRTKPADGHVLNVGLLWERLAQLAVDLTHRVDDD